MECLFPRPATGNRKDQPEGDWRVRWPAATNSPLSPTSVGIGQICFSAAGLIPHIRSFIPAAGRNQRNTPRRQPVQLSIIQIKKMSIKKQAVAKVTAAKPAPAAAKPTAAKTVKPAAAPKTPAAQPVATTPKPVATAAKPAVAAAKRVVTPKPAVTHKPAVVAAKPAAPAKPVVAPKPAGARKPAGTKTQTVTTDRKSAASTVSHEQIAKLAYQYSLKNQAASAEENWFKAEAKLRK
jgi:outer membrane biosynthesis protein TonB